MLWLNILTKKKFEEATRPELANLCDEKIFPWTATITTSENNKEVLTSDCHPLQMYWGMPRRIRLLPTNNKAPLPCSLCGIVSNTTISEYITKNYGINYSEHWRHPLSPYRLSKENQYFPMHPQPGGIGYQHWLAITLENPAAVIAARQKYLSEEKPEHDAGQLGNEIKVWAFGYDMDNMKARCWYENYMPFYNMPEECIEKIQQTVQQFIEVVVQARFYLSKALNLCKVPTTVARQQIWQQTETKFYEILKAVMNSLISDDNSSDEMDSIKREWLRYVQLQTRIIFEKLADIQHAESGMLKAYVKANNDLKKCLHGKKMFELLTLSKEK